MSKFNQLPVPVNLNISELAQAANYWFLVETTQVIRMIDLIARFHETTKSGRAAEPTTVDALAAIMQAADQFWTSSVRDLIDARVSLQRVSETINLLTDMLLLAENRKTIAVDAKAILDAFEEIRTTPDNKVTATRRAGVAKDVVKIIDSINRLSTATFAMLKETILRANMKPYFLDHLVAVGRCMCYAVVGNGRDAAIEHARVIITAVAIARAMDVQVVINEKSRSSSSSMRGSKSSSSGGGSSSSSGSSGQVAKTSQYGMVPAEAPMDVESIDARQITMKTSAPITSSELQREAVAFVALAGDIFSGNIKRIALLLPPKNEVAKLQRSVPTTATVLYHMYDDEEFQAWKKQCPEVYAPNAPVGKIRSMMMGHRLTLYCESGYTTDNKDGLLFLDDLLFEKRSDSGELVRVPGIDKQIVVYRIKRMLRRAPAKMQ